MTSNVPAQMDRNDLFDKLHRRLVGTLRRRFRERAEDMAQDAIALALEKYPDACTEADLFPLLLTIKKYLALEELRPGRTDQMPDNGFEYADRRSGPEQLLAEAEHYDLLVTAIDQLGTRCRDLIQLRLKEVDSPTIAATLNVTVNNLYQMEKRCLDRLRRIIRPQAAAQRA